MATKTVLYLIKLLFIKPKCTKASLTPSLWYTSVLHTTPGSNRFGKFGLDWINAKNSKT